MEQTIASKMTGENTAVKAYFEEKRIYFDQGNTLPYAFRKEMLKKLKAGIQEHEAEIVKALNQDLRKSETESFFTEIGVVKGEIDYALKNLSEWMKPKRRSTPLSFEPSKIELRYEPRGVVLIIAPWNYPFNLLFDPLVGAIAAGNTVVLKPSEDAPATAAITEKIISKLFKPEYVSVVQGSGSKVVSHLLKSHVFNHVFFTGSSEVGKIIAKQAAENLVSVTLELGGKSPAIIDSSADLKVAAKRLVWGKFINAGQTCVAPDYLLVESKIKEKFTNVLIETIKAFYGSDAQQSADYPRMINEKRFDAVTAYLKDGNILYGGKSDKSDLYIEPTLMDNVDFESSVMREEIFGPILPIIPFTDINQIFDIIRKNRYPLACYYFGTNKKHRELILNRISFGGGCVNNTLLHLGSPELPFGGVQTSGSGHYHGWHGFECFSHTKSLVISKTWFDAAIKYPPFNQSKLSWLKKLI